MFTYDELLMEADSNNLITKEKPLRANKGRIKGNRIAIKSDMTNTEKGCILAEELGHYHTTYGNIICQSSVSDQKQEIRARAWAYNKMIGITGIIEAYKHGCRSMYETADFLDVTELFLSEALQYYKNKYGTYTTLDKFVIYFEPSLGVLELI